MDGYSELFLTFEEYQVIELRFMALGRYDFVLEILLR